MEPPVFQVMEHNIETNLVNLMSLYIRVSGCGLGSAAGSFDGALVNALTDFGFHER
jgi:hypothetical protein